MKTTITGDRTRHLLTFNLNSAQGGEQIYILVPKLLRSDCLVPGSLHLLFEYRTIQYTAPELCGTLIFRSDI